MTTFTRRSTFAAFAAALLAPVVARAQGATVGPAGGVPSSTAPSNSQGTPSGGTGVVGTTRMPMGSSTGPASSGTSAEMTPNTPPRRRRRRHHHRARHATTAQ